MHQSRKYQGIVRFILIPLYVAFWTATSTFISLPEWSVMGYLLATGLFMLSIVPPLVLLVGVGYVLSYTTRVMIYSTWVLIGLSGSYYVAEHMNTLVRLEGEYAFLAWCALSAQIILGLLMGCMCASLQPYRLQKGYINETTANETTHTEQDSTWIWGDISVTQWRWLKWLSPIQRKWLLILVVLCIIIIAHILDIFYLVDLYPIFHYSLRFVFILSIVWLATFLKLNASLPHLLRAQSPIFIVFTLFACLISVNSNDSVIDDMSHIQKRGLFGRAIDQVRFYTDWDGDGFSEHFLGGDCQPYNPLIHPNAKEIPNNQVDENCLAGDFKGAPPSAFVPQPFPTQKTSSSVVLITIDTLRPDHMSVYGYQRNTTPRLKAWARKATRFNRAYSTSSWTSLAMPSLMLGLYPSKIKWSQMYETTKFRLLSPQDNHSLKDGEKLKLRFTVPIHEKRHYLAQTLRKRGLYTMAVVDDGYGEFLSHKTGIHKGFNKFQTLDRFPRHQRHDGMTIDLALKALKKRPKKKPFFLWVHLFGPHDPNHKHKSSPQFGTTLSDLYDHEIHFMDAQLARLLSALDYIQKKQKVTIFLTSDHGEMIKEHKRYHGASLTEALIRVPLLIKGHGWPAHNENNTVVSLVDLAPSILQAAGQTPASHAMDGVDLRTLITSDTHPTKHSKRVLFAETWFIRRSGRFLRDYLAAFDGTHKIVYNRLNRHTILYTQKKPSLWESEDQEHKKNQIKNSSTIDQTYKALYDYLEIYTNDRGVQINIQ